MSTASPHAGTPQRLVPADADRLALLMRTCFLQAYAHASSPDRVAAYLDRVYDPARICQELADPDLPTWAWVTPGGRWAGFGRLRLTGTGPDTPGKVVELQRFYLHADFHGTGIATPLLHHLLNAAQAAGAGRIQLSVWKDAPQAIRFYTREGFRIDGSTVFWIEDDPKDDWLMVRDLQGADI